MGDIWTTINGEVPLYMRELCKKYNPACRKISDLETALYNDQCCLIILIDRVNADIHYIIREKGKLHEYPCRNHFARKFDQEDRNGIITKPTAKSDGVRNDLIVFSQGLDHKWSNVLEGDRKWLEEYKRSAYYSDIRIRDEKREILESIVP